MTQETGQASITTAPDLLNHLPQESGNLRELRESLQYAFTTGESAGALRRALGECSTSPSTWDPECFAEDLFLDELVEECFRIRAARYDGDFVPPQSREFLKAALVAPPSAPDSVRFRQDIQRELLADEATRERFEAVYRDLGELREVLDSAGIMGLEYSTRRRIDILLQIKDTVDLLAEAFEGAASGIARISEWARSFQGTEGYAMLRDFVDYEGRLSNVQLKVQVGVDGSVRSFRVLSLTENTNNRFYENPLSRFAARVGLFFRGYRLGRDELVARLVERVFDAIEADLVHFLVLIGHIEFHLASLAFVDLCRAHGLETSLAVFIPNDEGRVVSSLFNPLLIGQTRPPVPCDLASGRAEAMTIVTGPNSGGKTRLLQALGLLQLLGQGGFAVPAAGARIHARPGLFLSLVEGFSVDQQEGRLGMELLRIRRLFEKSRPETLVLLDELCSGTNPSEGEEIFLLVISLLRKLRPEAIITTHFLRFAAQLMRDQGELGLDFLQVELDDDQVSTYSFVPGVAETSLAGHMAKRLGVTREHLIGLIEERIGREE